jgi:hypothetical protein
VGSSLCDDSFWLSRLSDHRVPRHDHQRELGEKKRGHFRSGAARGDAKAIFQAGM